VRQKTSGESSNSCSSGLERAGCPQKELCCGGDWVALGTLLCFSTMNFGIQGGGEGHGHEA